IMPSATMICSLVSFTPVSPRRWSGPETAHYKRFVNPRCAKLGVPREAKWRVLLHSAEVVAEFAVELTGFGDEEFRDQHGGVWCWMPSGWIRARRLRERT